MYALYETLLVSKQSHNFKHTCIEIKYTTLHCSWESNCSFHGSTSKDSDELLHERTAARLDNLYLPGGNTGQQGGGWSKAALMYVHTYIHTYIHMFCTVYSTVA